MTGDYGALGAPSYAPPVAADFDTRPVELPPYCSTSNYALADAVREKLVAGKRIRVNRWSPTLQGRHGVIVAVGEGERVGDGDCAVLLDEWDHPLAFYWQELEALT